MKDAFEEMGEWWLPKEPDKRVPGKLSWHPEKGAKLDLNGQLSVQFGGEPQSVFGQLRTLPPITLVDALVTGLQPSATGLNTTEIVANRIVRNFWSRDMDREPIVSLCVELTGLRAWMGGSCISKRREDRSDIIRFDRPRPILVGESEEFRLKLSCQNHSSQSREEYTLRDVALLTLEGKDGVFEFHAALEVVEEFRAFLAIALDRPVKFLAMRAESPETRPPLPNGHRFPVVGEVMLTQTEFVIEERTLMPWEMLFSLRDLDGRCVEAFSAFNTLYAANPLAVEFYLSSIYGKKGYVNQRFADLSHGLEGLHRILLGGTYMEPARYETDVLPVLTAAIPKDMSADLKASLQKRLEFGNEFSLRKRLKDLAGKYGQGLEPLIGTPKGLSDEIVILRNALAHATLQSKTDREQIIRMAVLSLKLRLLYQAILLREFGLPNDFVHESLRRTNGAQGLAAAAARTGKNSKE